MLRLLICATLLLMVPPLTLTVQAAYAPAFDGSLAFTHLTAQCSFGARPPGSDNLSLCRNYIAGCLTSYGWHVTFQNFTYIDVGCTNVICRWGPSENASLVLGAHYDTRPRADQDSKPENRMKPIIGANDGASGVAVLIEFANALPEAVRQSVELVFFDAEDSGGINGWQWIVGSTYYVEQLSAERKNTIRAMILLDMVGGAGLRLLRETTSIKSLQDTVWSIAQELGYGETFLNENGAPIIDDHKPFLDSGIPSLDIIEHDPFPWYWHTLEDTPDKCNATSLDVVGEVVETFVVQYAGKPTTFSPDTTLLPYAAAAIVLLIISVAAFSRVRRR